MIVECDNCGAPLDVAPKTVFVPCRYCKHTSKVAGTRTLMAMTPADWRPPAEWDVQQRRAAQGAAVGVAAATGIAGCVPAIVAVVGLIVAAGGVGAAVYLSDGSSGGGGMDAVPGLGPAWDGMTPFVCGGNDTVRIDGVTASLPNDVAISARANCRVEVTNSHITARVGIEAEGNRDVRVSGCTIQATQTGIRVSQNKSLDLSDTTIVAGEAAVEAGGNARVTLHSGQLEGSPAVDARQNARFDQRGGQLVDK